MTTKKIQSGEELGSSLLRGLSSLAKRKKSSPGQDQISIQDESEGQSAEKINIELSKSINSEFNPELLANERKEKIEKLKELIKSGKYNPKSEDIAQALQQDIVFEIISAPKDTVNQ